MEGVWLPLKPAHIQCILYIWIYVKYLLKHASNVSHRTHTLKHQWYTGVSHTYVVYLIHSHDAKTGASVRQTHSHWGERNLQAAAMESRYGNCFTSTCFSLSSLSLSLCLSFSLHEPLSRGQSLIDCCRGNILLLCISNPVIPFATSLPGSHFISGKWPHTHFLCTHLCILHQEMKTDSHWHHGRQNADALMYPPTPT